MLSDFQILEKLGEGAYSSVFKVRRSKDKNQYALKKVLISDLSDKEKENAFNEVRFLASIQHPNIIAYRQAFFDQDSASLCIVMEFANDGDVFQLISKHKRLKEYIEEDRIWSIAVQSLKGLSQLHKLKILHRDIKSANIFLTKEGKVKLGDMNVSKIAKKGLLYTQTGTPFYASPQVWRQKPYNHKSDIWSLGCVIYEICSLRPPFRSNDLEGLCQKIVKGAVPKIPQVYSSELYELIKWMLMKQPQRRPTCEMILESQLVKSRELDNAQPEVQSNSMLINTIRVPQDLYYLTDALPLPNYSNNRNRPKRQKQRTEQASLALPNIGKSYQKEHSYRNQGSVVGSHKLKKKALLRNRRQEQIQNVYGKRPKENIQILGSGVRQGKKNSMKLMVLPSLGK